MASSRYPNLKNAIRRRLEGGESLMPSKSAPRTSFSPAFQDTQKSISPQNMQKMMVQTAMQQKMKAAGGR